MTIDELKHAWRRRLEAEAGAAQPGLELGRARERVRELESAVRRRDWIETGCALAVLPVFGYFALSAANPIVRLGSAVLALACIAIPIRLRAARGRTPDPTLPVADYLKLQLELVLRQRRLLLTVPLWYLGPLGVGVVLFFAGASPSVWLTGVYVAVVVVFMARLYQLNRAAVRSELEPRERELRMWIELLGADRPADAGSEKAGEDQPESRLRSRERSGDGKGES